MLWFSKLGRFFLPRPIDALVSRRLPEGLDNATLIAVDLTDPARCADVFGHMPEVTHVIYAALYEKPGLVQGWFEQDQMQTNLAMLDNVMTPLETRRQGAPACVAAPGHEGVWGAYRAVSRARARAVATPPA